MTSLFLGIGYLTLHNNAYTFHFLLQLKSISYVYVPHFHYSFKSVERHLVCFLFLVIVHRAVVNMVEQVSVLGFGSWYLHGGS